MTPEITVLMPVYNGEKYLKDAINSILAQTYTNFEFLIINDGSTDSTAEIINSYNDHRIKLINQENGGVSKALNQGLKIARGKYIARMDADDISYSHRLQMQYNFMEENPEYLAIGGDVNYITESGEFIFKYSSPFYSHEEIKEKVVAECAFIHSTVMFRKESVIQLDGYPERAHSFEDHMLWVSLIKLGKLCVFNEVLGEYRFNSSSVTVDFKDYEKSFLELKQKAIRTGKISEEEEVIIKNSLKKLNSRKKEISYNRLLAKKYLWNNYSPKKARKNLKVALKLDPFSISTISLLALSFLPKKVIENIYHLGKR